MEISSSRQSERQFGRGQNWWKRQRKGHITLRKELFKELDETKKQKVKLGVDKEIQVDGEGTMAITASADQAKLLYKVQYVPTLAHSLLILSVILS